MKLSLKIFIIVVFMCIAIFELSAERKVSIANIMGTTFAKDSTSCKRKSDSDKKCKHQCTDAKGKSACSNKCPHKKDSVSNCKHQ